jgi:hypothetical protein
MKRQENKKVILALEGIWEYQIFRKLQLQLVMEDLFLQEELLLLLIAIFPNLHLRIGPPKFNIQAGISDRYVGVYNPLSAHLSLGFLNKTQIPIQLGLMTQYYDYPLETMGTFFQYNGGLKNYTLILGSSGGSLALRYNFLK